MNRFMGDHARIQRGLGPEHPPPSKIGQRWVFYGCLMGRRGVQKVMLSYYYRGFFWLALCGNSKHCVNV